MYFLSNQIKVSLASMVPNPHIHQPPPGAASPWLRPGDSRKPAPTGRVVSKPQGHPQGQLPLLPLPGRGGYRGPGRPTVQIGFRIPIKLPSPLRSVIICAYWYRGVGDKP